MKVPSLFVPLVSLLITSCDRSHQTVSLPSETPKSLAQDSAMNEVWPFDDPQNVAVITLKRIMDGSHPILYVRHDVSDGGWQFLDGDDVAEEGAAVVSLREIANHDPTIKQLADLPLGWHARREAVGKPWQRSSDAH